MFEKFEKLKKEYKEVEKKLTLPEIADNPSKIEELGRRYGELKEQVETYRKYLKLKKEYEQAKNLFEQEKADMKDLAAEEMEILSEKIEKTEKELKNYLLPKDPDENKDVIIEIRAGTGGDEAALFCYELYRMYARFAESSGWNIDIYSSNKTGLGGFKEIIFSVEGKNVYGNLKWESGVHRVQRVPETESGGRIHTSACSVAVLSHADPVEINISKDDLRIDTYRASGKGGQHVNVTDSAVRITHLPTGIVVQCQDERSQMQNKRKAMNMLRARIKEHVKIQQEKEQGARRRNQIGSGDRSEKIRTYNFPQNRVTDHRAGLTVHKLEELIDGNLAEFLEEIKKRIREKQLREL